MGVPKFFRWISERYPNLSVNIENNQIPIFDCLYLDMNGIIHVCSHPDDANVQFRITEEQIFSNVFNYIDFLFKTVKPKEVFFLAVDGVAPRAKMNQQRGRRFKSSKEAKDRDFAAIQSGVILPVEKRFDSNAITPGTEFMDRLQQSLRASIAEKMSSDSLWHGVDVILSGHETPGEGEHKIQEFIRYRRSLPDYNPNTRHCLYGLDADLMLLGLASHEPYFSLLREEVTFTVKNKTRRAYIAEETKFFLLHLSLLRDYIDYEFSGLKTILGNEYDLERIIDDWIVMSFFVGNDFVPHLPNLHIHTSALPLLWHTYLKMRPMMDGYMNDSGHLNLRNIMTYVSDLSTFDHKHFEEMFDDMKWMFGKTGERMAKEMEELGGKTLGNKRNGTGVDVYSDIVAVEKDLIDFDETETEEDVIDTAMNGLDLIDIEETDDGDGVWQMQFRSSKVSYYYDKLGITMSAETIAEQAREYFTALQWISYYYFSGVPSWSWFYPQHYAPFVSDLVNLSGDIIESGIKFDIGTPFLPFEQLMAVLPADSAELLPDCFNILMTMDTSPIIDFYPRTFKSDLNGKKREWEALVLIPFIDEKRLLATLESRKNMLTKDEARRNVHSSHIKFRFSQKQLTVIEIEPSVFRIPRDAMVFGLCPNVQLDVICHGFPTFRHVTHTVANERAFVRVFENHSTHESIVLRITPAVVPPTAESVAECFLQKLTYVNWPAFILTKVVAVLDKGNRISLDPTTNKLVTIPLEETEAKKLNDFIAAQPQEFYKRRAVTLDPSNMIVLETLHSEGNVYEIVSCHKAGCNVRLERNWIVNKSHWHLHQLSVLQESIESLKTEEPKVCTKLSQLFPVGELVFCLDPDHYGQSGRIVSINNSKGSIAVALQTLKEPDYSEIDANSTGDSYMSAVQAAEYLDLDANLLSKITGSIFLSMSRMSDNRGRQKNKDRYSIGLDLKNNKLNLQVPGWVIKSNGENGMAKWMYSMKVVKIVDEYRDNFPLVFEFFKRPNFETLTIEDVFEVNGNMTELEQKFDELKKYLDSLEYRKVEKLSNDHKLLAESQIETLEKYTDNVGEHAHSIRTEAPCEIELMFKSLYRPHHSLQGTRPDVTAEYRLLDRVVCCCEGYTVPLGLRGVVIGVEPLAGDQIRLEVLFDREFKAAISIRGSRVRCYRMPPYTLINTTHGERKHKCAGRVVGRRLLPAVVRNTSNSNYVNTKSSSGNAFLATLFSAASAELPPMPSKKYSETMTTKKGTNVAISEHRKDTVDGKATKKTVPKANSAQKDFLLHCDQLFKNTMPVPLKMFTQVITIENCPSEYKALFDMCIQCGIHPMIEERYVGADIFMSFKCNVLETPEFKETDLIRGRQNHASRVWQHLYSLQQQRQYGPPPQRFQQRFVPPQFQNNPFLGLSPARMFRGQLDHSVSTAGPDLGRKAPRRSKSDVTVDGLPAGNDSRPFVDGTKGSGQRKKFIKAPRPKVVFMKEDK